METQKMNKPTISERETLSILFYLRKDKQGKK